MAAGIQFQWSSGPEEEVWILKGLGGGRQELSVNWVACHFLKERLHILYSIVAHRIEWGRPCELGVTGDQGLKKLA